MDVAEASFGRCTGWSDIFINLGCSCIHTPGISLFGSERGNAVGNTIVVMAQ